MSRNIESDLGSGRNLFVEGMVGVFREDWVVFARKFKIQTLADSYLERYLEKGSSSATAQTQARQRRYSQPKPEPWIESRQEKQEV